MSSPMHELLSDLGQDVAALRLASPREVRARGEARARHRRLGAAAAGGAVVLVTAATVAAAPSMRPLDAPSRSGSGATTWCPWGTAAPPAGTSTTWPSGPSSSPAPSSSLAATPTSPPPPEQTAPGPSVPAPDPSTTAGCGECPVVTPTRADLVIVEIRLAASARKQEVAAVRTILRTVAGPAESVPGDATPTPGCGSVVAIRSELATEGGLARLTIVVRTRPEVAQRIRGAVTALPYVASVTIRP